MHIRIDIANVHSNTTRIKKNTLPAIVIARILLIFGLVLDELIAPIVVIINLNLLLKIVITNNTINDNIVSIIASYNNIISELYI